MEGIIPPPEGPAEPTLHRWLRSRIASALDEDAPSIEGESPESFSPLRPRTVRQHDPNRPAAPNPAYATGLGRPRSRPLPIEEDDEDAIETVLESQWGDRAPLEDLITEDHLALRVDAEGDARTERREPMPVGFINEAVMDDQTVEDPATASKKWREEAIFNVTPTMPGRQSPRAPSRPKMSAAPPPPAPVPRVRPAGASRRPPAPPTPPPGIRAASPSLAPRRPPTASQRPAAVRSMPPPPPPGLRTVTPPTGQSASFGLPEMDASLSPPPPHRTWVTPAWAPEPPAGPRPASPPANPSARPWWERRPSMSAVVGTTAIGVMLGALTIAVAFMW